jgi:signal transduction histidine kinase
VLHASDACARALHGAGDARASVVGRSALALVPHDVADASRDTWTRRVRDALERSVATSRPQELAPLDRADDLNGGAPASTRVRCAPVLGAGDVVVAIVLSFTPSPETTAQRALEAALRKTTAQAREAVVEARRARELAEQAAAAKGQFLTTMSHELRTPLNAIAGYAQIMQLGLRGPVTTQQAEDLRRILRAEEHLLGLVNEVLAFAKLGAGRVRYHLADVHVPSVLAEVASIVQPLVAAKRLTHAHEGCDVGAGDVPLLARADAEKLRQVLINLLTNAVKFTAPGGRITVRCDVGESAAGAPVVRVDVTDTGVGIAPEQLERVFDPFVQLDRQLSSSHDGVGLGLAISRELARGMSGDVTVTSAPGVGSRFTLTLPAASPRP